jgi:Domain of unknown function (DUF5664)
MAEQRRVVQRKVRADKGRKSAHVETGERPSTALSWDEVRREVIDFLDVPNVKFAEGVKYDEGKPQVSLIPATALIAEAKVMTYGAKKYERHNWRKGMAWSRPLDAALRHVLAFANGENNDPETGLPHLAHARCCLAFLIDYVEKGYGKDDRF